MSVMLQSGLDIAPVITHRFHYNCVSAGFRRDELRQFRQGHPELGVAWFPG